MDDQPNDQEQAAEVRIEDQLRSIKADSWAYITEPNGWSYHTNIGVLAHKAVGHIVSLQQKAEAPDGEVQLPAALLRQAPWVLLHFWVLRLPLPTLQTVSTASSGASRPAEAGAFWASVANPAGAKARVGRATV